MSVRATQGGYTFRIDANASGFAFSGLQRFPNVQTPEYTVWVSGTLYQAMRQDGVITHSGTNLRVIMDSITDSLCQSGVASGGTIFFKEGLYLPTARFDVPNDDTLAAQYASLSGNCSITIKGEDRDRTIIRCTVENSHIFQPRTSRFRLENMTLDGSGISASCISTDYGIHVEVDHCRFMRYGHGDPTVSGSLGSSGWYGFAIWLGNNTAGGSGMWLSGVHSFRITDNIFEMANSAAEDCCPTCTDWGIVSHNTFNKTYADDQGWGGSQLTGGSARNWVATNNTFTRHSGNQLCITKELNGDEKNITIANNNIINGRVLVGFSSLGNEGISMREVNITDNIIRGGNITVQGPDTNSFGSGISDSAVWRDYVQNVVVQGNVIDSSYFKGIKLYRCEFVTVKNNYMRNSNMAGSAITGTDLGLINAEQTFNCVIEDNTLVMDDNRTAYGIRWISGTNLRISNNHIKNTTTSGNASYIDGGVSNIATTFVEDMSAEVLPTRRKTGILNPFAATGTSNLGTGILSQRFSTDSIGTGTFSTTTYVSGEAVRTITTGASGGSVAGWRYVTDLLRRDAYPKLTVRFSTDQLTNTRFGAFFASNSSVAPISGGSADPMSGRNGIGFWYDRAVSANIRSIRNSGVSASTVADILGNTAWDTNMHTFSVYGDNVNSKWILEYDYKRIEYSTTIPMFNSQMGFFVYMESHSGVASTGNMSVIKLETN